MPVNHDAFTAVAHVPLRHGLPIANGPKTTFRPSKQSNAQVLICQRAVQDAISCSAHSPLSSTGDSRVKKFICGRSAPIAALSVEGKNRIFIWGRNLPTAALSVEGPTKDELC
jgi:hypothetical protein